MKSFECFIGNEEIQQKTKKVCETIGNIRAVTAQVCY